MANLKPFLIEYLMEDEHGHLHVYGDEIDAESHQDAVKRLQRIKETGRVLGKKVFEFPVPKWVCVCGLQPCAGLDCGVPIPSPRTWQKCSKTPAERTAIRQKAWATRRLTYGPKGHR